MESFYPKNADELHEGPREAEPAFLDTPVKSNDPRALKEKALTDKNRELKYENDLREILNTQGGIRFIARILNDPCYYYANYWSPNYGEMSNIAGRRQVGNKLVEWVKDLDLELWFRVERELETLRPKPKTSEPKRG